VWQRVRSIRVVDQLIHLVTSSPFVSRVLLRTLGVFEFDILPTAASLTFINAGRSCPSVALGLSIRLVGQAVSSQQCVSLRRASTKRTTPRRGRWVDTTKDIRLTRVRCVDMVNRRAGASRLRAWTNRCFRLFTQSCFSDWSSNAFVRCPLVVLLRWRCRSVDCAFCSSAVVI
jgi:hypothetical protein